MDHLQIRQWELAVDAAEQTPLTADLPEDATPGDIYKVTAADGVVRTWRRVIVISGNVGGRWAYWASWMREDEATRRNVPGQGLHPSGSVVADKIFNGDAAHFVGMLATPYVAVPGVKPHAWVLIDPRAEGPRTTWAEAKETRERYEKSKEIYDVETGRSTRLP